MLKIITKEGKEYQVEGSEINGTLSNADIQKTGKGEYHIIRNGKSYRVTLVKSDWANKTISLRIRGKKYTVKVKDKYDEVLEKLGLNSQTKSFKDLKAPMPGKVLDVMVKAGDTIAKDQPLLVLEAMKMENVIKAPADVKIKSIAIDTGKTVEKNQVLIQFE